MPEVKRYPENGLTMGQIKEIANERMEKWGKRWVIPAGWHFSFNKLKNSLGYCRYNQKTIQLSVYWLNRPKADLIKTIDHEIAHIIAGSLAAHGPEWKAIMLQMGHAPDRCSQVDPSVAGPKYKYGIFYENKLVKGYHNRPARKVYANLPTLYLLSDPVNTKGKLEIRQIG